jgi:hypothetical protein
VLPVLHFSHEQDDALVADLPHAHALPSVVGVLDCIEQAAKLATQSASNTLFMVSSYLKK